MNSSVAKSRVGKLSELIGLASILAEWSENTTATVYLFGSRVRGDHRDDSDVDIVIDFAGGNALTSEWWERNQADHFACISTQLPGQLHCQPLGDPMCRKVIAAAEEPVYTERNVVCVWFPPKG